MLDVDQDAVTKVEKSKVSKLREAKFTDCGASTCDPRHTSHVSRPPLD